MLDTSHRSVFDESQELFRDQVRRFFDRELRPHLDRWEQQGVVDREFWTKCGEAGLLCPTVPQQYGGLGVSFVYNCIIAEELYYAGAATGIGVHSDLVADYIVHYGSEEQKRHWLPRMISGEIITAIAMTEPGAGSDLQSIRTTALRDGDHYRITGAKTYISNGPTADLVIVVAKTAPDQRAKGISLILVEANRPGFGRGRKLDKIGQRAADTGELFFDDLRVPVGNLLGEENKGFSYLMGKLPQERLGIAVAAQAGAQRAFDEAVRFTRDRKAFGKRVIEFQNTRFVLADIRSKLQVGWVHLDWCIARHAAGKLTAAEAASAKLHHTEVAWNIIDAALQLHGGAGYMNEYPIARLWRDHRVQRIYGGTSEIMKEVVSRSIV